MLADVGWLELFTLLSNSNVGIVFLGDLLALIAVIETKSTPKSFVSFLLALENYSENAKNMNFFAFCKTIESF